MDRLPGHQPGPDAPVDQEAKSYKIQVSHGRRLLDDPGHRDGRPADVYALGHDHQGPLYWRVRAIDQTNNFLTVSETRLVTKSSPAPVETFPADGDTVSRVPYLAWGPQDYAARYTVEVYEGPNDGTWSPGGGC
jgi:hypothetical protein